MPTHIDHQRKNKKNLSVSWLQRQRGPTVNRSNHLRSAKLPACGNSIPIHSCQKKTRMKLQQKYIRNNSYILFDNGFIVLLARSTLSLCLCSFTFGLPLCWPSVTGRRSWSQHNARQRESPIERERLLFFWLDSVRFFFLTIVRLVYYEFFRLDCNVCKSVALVASSMFVHINLAFLLYWKSLEFMVSERKKTGQISPCPTPTINLSAEKGVIWKRGIRAPMAESVALRDATEFGQRYKSIL